MTPLRPLCRLNGALVFIQPCNICIVHDGYRMSLGATSSLTSPPLRTACVPSTPHASIRREESRHGQGAFLW